jgi:hypothetical protein
MRVFHDNFILLDDTLLGHWLRYHKKYTYADDITRDAITRCCSYLSFSINFWKMYSNRQSSDIINLVISTQIYKCYRVHGGKQNEW